MPMFELIDKWGRKRGQFRTAKAAVDWAAHLFPDQQQDADRTGIGWDVQEVDAEPPASRASHYS